MSINSRRRHLLTKRILDTSLVIVTLPVTVPLGVITAMAVRAILGHPVLYRQQRIGLNENSFELLKFRSMLPEKSPDGKKLDPNERLTPFGRIIRRSSLDELPQLINVLKGDMSLVGPRPLLVEYLPYYRESERIRHSVRPGLTGASQVKGRNNLSWDQRLASDAEYAQNWSLKGDLSIIFKTLEGVLRRKDTVAEPWNQGEYLSVYRSYPSDGQFALRRFEPKDIETRVKWLKDDRTKKTMTVGEDITVESTAAWLKKVRKDPLRKDFVVYDLETLDTVAIAGFKATTKSDLPIVYLAVDPDRQGQGLGKITLGLLLDYMKQQEWIRGAAGELFRENIRTIRINERYGFNVVDANLPSDRVRMEVRW